MIIIIIIIIKLIIIIIKLIIILREYKKDTNKSTNQMNFKIFTEDKVQTQVLVNNKFYKIVS